VGGAHCVKSVYYTDLTQCAQCVISRFQSSAYDVTAIYIVQIYFCRVTFVYVVIVLFDVAVSISPGADGDWRRGIM